MRAVIPRWRTGSDSSARRVRTVYVTAALAAVALAGCHGASRSMRAPTPSDGGSSRPSADQPEPPRDFLATYRRGGFLVASGDIPFVGSVGFFAGPAEDTTLAVVAFSMPNRALTFTRDGERYRASYDVVLELLGDDGRVRRQVAHEDVRVGNFKETSREEESIIFQQVVKLAAGSVLLSISARDAGSTRVGATQTRLVVPRFSAGTITTPVAVFRARPRARRESRLDVIMRPRATAVFGRDSIVEFYLEGYDAASRLLIQVEDESEDVVFSDTAAFDGEDQSLRGTLLRVPVARLGFGVLTLIVSPVSDDSTAPAATVRTPLLVTFGDGLAVSSFGEMLSYLRFFSTPERLRSLREAGSVDRPRAWASFLEATDPVPSTAENEGLRDYLGRLAEANIRFREDETPGWMTDRGMVFATFGEPENRIEPPTGDPVARTRVEIWEYQRHRVRLVFVDQTGFGRWRLTPNSEADYYALLRRSSR